MTEELKQRFDLWLNACLTIDGFKKKYNKMLSEMRPVNVEKLKNFEEINESKTKNGQYYYNHLRFVDYDGYDEKLIMTLKRSNISYILRLINRDLSDVPVRVVPPASDRIDHDWVAVLEVENEQTKQHAFNEVFVMQTRQDYRLVFRELIYNGCNYEPRGTQVQVLTDEQVNALLGNIETKQL